MTRRLSGFSSGDIRRRLADRAASASVARLAWFELAEAATRRALAAELQAEAAHRPVAG